MLGGQSLFLGYKTLYIYLVVCRTDSRGLHPQLLDSSDWDCDVWLTSNVWREVSQPLALSPHLSPSSLSQYYPWLSTHTSKESH